MLLSLSPARHNAASNCQTKESPMTLPWAPLAGKNRHSERPPTPSPPWRVWGGGGDPTEPANAGVGAGPQRTGPSLSHNRTGHLGQCGRDPTRHFGVRDGVSLRQGGEWSPPPGSPREVLEVGGGKGSGTQKFVYQKWPDQFFPIVNFVFFPQWSLWSGGGGALLAPGAHLLAPGGGGGRGYPRSSDGAQSF